MAIWIKKVATTPLNTIAKVIDSLATQTNDTTNAPSIHAVREALNDKWETIYPIGSIYMSVNNVNPSTVFGGTWEQIKDKFLLACGDTYNNGATGGEATHTLTSDEMPSHNHGYDKATGADDHVLTENEMPSHKHMANILAINSTHGTYYTELYDKHVLGVTDGPQYSVDATAQSYTPPLYLSQYSSDGYTHNTGGGAAHSHTVSTTAVTSSDVGGSQAHNNMPPYLAVNVWVRTA